MPRPGGLQSKLADRQQTTVSRLDFWFWQVGFGLNRETAVSLWMSSARRAGGAERSVDPLQIRYFV
jgi:hypothetical protein